MLSFQDGFCWRRERPESHPSVPSRAGIAVALRQATTPEFKAYQQQVVANCRALSAALTELGYDIVTGEDSSGRRDGADPCAGPRGRHGHDGQGSAVAIPQDITEPLRSSRCSFPRAGALLSPNPGPGPGATLRLFC